MFEQLYQNTVLKKPKIILLFLIVALLGFGYFSKDFKLDASSDTLLIDGDITLYQIACKVEVATDWGEGMWTLHSDLKQGIPAFDTQIALQI
mgnify:CR=1 FL=1